MNAFPNLSAMLGCALVGVACSAAPPSPSGPVASSTAAPPTSAVIDARLPVDPVWTDNPALDAVPSGPVRGVFQKKRFALEELRFERTGNGEVQLVGQSRDSSVELKLPVLFAPEEGLCVRRRMGESWRGRINVSGGGYGASSRLFSNVFGYVLQIDRAGLRPYARGPEPTAEGQRLGTVSGRLLVMFAEEAKYGGGGPGWIGGHFEDIPVMQKGDLGAVEPCSKGPVHDGLGTAHAFRADIAPRVTKVKAGPVSGKIGKLAFDTRGVVLIPRFASDSSTAGWDLLFSTTALGKDLLPRPFEVLQGSGILPGRSVRVGLDEEPKAGVCGERTADFAFSGPIPELEPLHVQLSITAYTPPTPDAPGRLSGAAVLDWMEGSYLAGTFTDAPVLHPASAPFASGSRPIAPERCPAAK